MTDTPKIADTLEISMAMVSNIWCKQMHFLTAGTQMPGHLHNHNHITLLAKGKLAVTVNGEVSEFTAPHLIFIHKDHVHDLLALEDDTLAYCIHAVRDIDTGDIMEGVSIPSGAHIQPIIRLEE